MKGSRDFWQEFHARGMNVQRLAEAIHSKRSHVTQVLNGTRPGSQTRRKLISAQLLTERELHFLGWDAESTRVASPRAHGARPAGSSNEEATPPASRLGGVPHGTKSHVEHPFLEL
jgi:hypothetical protein